LSADGEVNHSNIAFAIEDLTLGDGERLDAVISALPTIEDAIDGDDLIKVVGNPLFAEELAAAIDKNAPLDSTTFVQRVSEIITEMHEDGTLRELSEKWYGIDLSAPDVQESGDE
jgi:polar amino acid transport system substrate-binding protein